jgi:molybdopterin converting factor small subunit
VRILLFATAREAVGAAALDREVPSDGRPVGALLDSLGAEYPALRPVLRHARIVRNGRYVSGRAGRVRPGDEVAIHPPYSGG